MRTLARLAEWWRGEERDLAAEIYPSFYVGELEPRRVLDAGPVIAPQAFDVNYNAANGTSVGTVLASDPDPGDLITYDITGGNTNNTFQIDADTGLIEVNQNNQLAATQLYNLTVEVTDTTNKKASATITIVVNDPPVVNNQSFIVGAGSPTNTPVGTVVASDPENNALAYAITAGNTGTAFKIDANTGAISVDNAAAIVTPGDFLLTVSVTDPGLLADTAQIAIRVNGAPTDIVLSNQVAVPENTSAAIVGDVSVTDPNPGDNFSYIVDDARFEVAAGKLKLKAGQQLNYEADDSFDVQITATDAFGASYAESFTITVTDRNDPPTAILLANDDVNENTPGAIIGQLTVTDPDDPGGVNGQHTFVVEEGGVTSTRFEVNGAGQLKLIAGVALNYETASTVQLTIIATDGGAPGLSCDDDFTINVNNANDAPSFTKGADQTSDEDAGPQTVVGWATNISPGPLDEAGQTVSFEITNNTNSALFSAGPAVAANGTLTYTAAADAHGSATITLRIRDDGGTTNGGIDASATQTFTITIDAVNDAPSFTKGADQTVDEDAAPQTVNGWATNISTGPANESGQTPSFEVTGNTNAGLFSAGPAIAADGTLTYTLAANANGTATITIQLRDSGGTANGGVDVSPTQQFTITVNAVNDAPTLGNGTLAAVAEDTANPAGQTVATIFAGQFNDIDALSSFSGIAVVGNTANAVTQGAWQYSTNGVFWYDIGAVTDGVTALALSATTLIRFVPVADFNGAPTALVVRGLDDTYVGGFSSTPIVEARQTVDTTVRGGTTAIANATATLSTTITAANDAPVVTTTVAALAYTENQAATPIDSGLTVVDIDSANLAGATIQITGNYVNGQDVLAFTNQLGITGNWVAATGTLTLSGNSSVANYQTALRAVTYVNTSNSPNIATRTVTFIASDASLSSAPQTRDITVTPINDAPTLGNGILAAVAEDTANPPGKPWRRSSPGNSPTPIRARSSPASRWSATVPAQ